MLYRNLLTLLTAVALAAVVALSSCSSKSHHAAANYETLAFTDVLDSLEGGRVLDFALTDHNASLLVYLNGQYVMIVQRQLLPTEWAMWRRYVLRQHHGDTLSARSGWTSEITLQ